MKKIIFIVATLLSLSRPCAADEFTYDALNRLTRVTFANGATVDYTYDAMGNLLSTANTGVYTVSTNVGTNGSISPEAQTVTVGYTTSFTLTPNDGYSASASGCGGSLDGNTYTTGAITADCTVTTNFADSAPPTGSISINSGAVSSNLTTATLILSCTDASGCAEMRFTNDNTNWSTPEPYSTIKTWTLDLGDGTKTVYVNFKDTAGNWSGAYSDTIVLDTTVPFTTASAAGGTYNLTKSITLTCSDGTGSGCDKVYYTTDGSTPSTLSTVFTTPMTVSATSTMKFFAKDLAGNSETVKTEIYTIDTTAPVFSSIFPASNSFINTATVGYALSEDVSAGQITFTRTGGTVDVSSPHVYNFTSADLTSGSHTVNTGFALVNGAVYTVSFDALDAAGNAATTVSNTNINFDTASASATIGSPASGSRVNNSNVGYTLSEAISSGNIVFTVTGGTADAGSPHTFTLTGGELSAGAHNVSTGIALVDRAIYTVSIENVFDAAGNATATVSNTGATYDFTAVAITDSTPAANAVITTATVSYMLSEAAQSGKVTFTWTSGIIDAGSPHVYNLGGAELYSGAQTVDTGLLLVDGAIYTVSFDATDMAGNPATTVSNAIVLFDNIHDITVTITGSGRVTPSGATGVSHGDTRTFTATPDPGYHIASITGCGGSLAGNTFTTGAITADCTVTASFAIDTFTVTPSVGSGGSIAPSTPQTLNYGSTASFTITPNTGHHLTSVTGCGGTLIGNTYTTGAVTLDCAVTSNFAIDTFALNFVSGGKGTLTGTARQTISYGSDATAVTAVPSTGYQFLNWTGTGGFVTTTSNPLTVTNVTAVQTITSNFAINTYDIIVGRTGTGTGTVTSTDSRINCGADCTEIYNHGTTVTLTATADTGSSFTAWSGACSGTGSCTVTMDAAKSVTATFADIARPILAVSTLSDGSRTNNATLNVSGTVTDNTGVQALTVNGSAVTVNTDGSFSYALVLGEGANVITIIATDQAGNQTTDTRTIILDTAAPALVISTPADNSNTALSIATVTGTLDENSTVTVILNGGTPKYASLTGNTFTLDTVLSYGVNTIELTATDTVGNASTQKRTVTYDNTKPSVEITSPNQDIRTNQNSMLVKGTVSDALTAVTITLTVDGNTFTPVISNGQFEQAVTFTSEKTYTVAVTATDEVGNTTTVQRNIIYDVTQPALSFTVTTPTNANSQIITGTMEEGSTVTVSSATATVGTVIYPKSTTWNVNIAGLAEGSNSIKAIAKDAAGNETAVAKQIVVDTVAPVTTATPGGGMYSSSQSVTLTCSDGTGSGCDRIYYTIDGTIPTTASSVYSTAISISATTTLKFFAVDMAGNSEMVRMESYSIDTTLNTVPPVFTSISPASNSFINTATVGYTLSSAVFSGKITFARTGGTADSSVHVYTFTSSDITAGSHSINTGLVLVNGAVYTVTFEAMDSTGNTGSLSSTNVTYDTSSASVTISSPAANSVVNNAKVSYTLSEDVSAGEIVFTRTGGAADGMSPYKYTLAAADRTKGSYTIDTGKPLMSGTIYTVSFENVKDMAGNATANVTNTTVTYDSTAVAITKASPGQNSIIGTAAVSYTLSEQASSGKVTFTRTGGSEDAKSPHIYTLNGSELTMGSHTVTTNLTLIEGSFYTVSFDATDLVGNAATTISNAMVYYDSNYGKGPVGSVDNAGPSANRVDGYDLIKLSIAFGSKPGDANWNPVCDLDKNGKVDGNDLVTLGNHFGEVQ